MVAAFTRTVGVSGCNVIFPFTCELFACTVPPAEGVRRDWAHPDCGVVRERAPYLPLRATRSRVHISGRPVTHSRGERVLSWGQHLCSPAKKARVSLRGQAAAQHSVHCVASLQARLQRWTEGNWQRGEWKVFCDSVVKSQWWLSPTVPLCLWQNWIVTKHKFEVLALILGDVPHLLHHISDGTFLFFCSYLTAVVTCYFAEPDFTFELRQTQTIPSVFPSIFSFLPLSFLLT